MAEDERARAIEERVSHRAHAKDSPAMTVLTRDVLLEEIAQQRIRIEPLEASQIGPASIDLTLGDEIRVIERGSEPIPIRDDVDYRDHTRLASLAKPYVLAPGATIHGITRERVTLANDLCGLLEGRSRFARLGLMIHVTSAFVQPGVSNRQVLEISNVSGHPLEIHAGVRICQLVVMRAEGQAAYRGRFADQERL
jgi:dCTP deaminase